jgi:peptidoglycan hydrolase CwlO-like protein
MGTTSIDRGLKRTLPFIIIIIIIIITAIELLLGGSSPYTSTDITNKNKYTKRNNTKNTVQTIQNTVHTIQNTVQTIQNTVNTNTHITETTTQYKTHTYAHPHITKQVKTNTVQDIPK